MEKVSTQIKLLGGLITSIMTLIFGQYWFLFAFYLGLNIVDWLTGWAKAKKKNEGSSKMGIQGILKKLGYWVIIMVAFGCSMMFVNIGDILGINLVFMLFMGWFTLATLITNEVVSILENLIVLGYKVPHILIKGLKIAGDFINNAGNKILPGKKEQ